jgi:hypothetical protein
VRLHSGLLIVLLLFLLLLLLNLGKFIPEHCSCDILKDLKFMVEVDYNFNITFENFRFSLYKIVNHFMMKIPINN